MTLPLLADIKKFDPDAGTEERSRGSPQAGCLLDEEYPILQDLKRAEKIARLSRVVEKADSGCI
ncbi:MAG: hypothetical protein U0798_05855 [Gemmataceae bacterium]